MSEPLSPYRSHQRFAVPFDYAVPKSRGIECAVQSTEIYPFREKIADPVPTASIRFFATGTGRTSRNRISLHARSLAMYDLAMDLLSHIRTAGRLVAAALWCISLGLLLVFWFAVARAVVWPILDRAYADIARAISKDQVQAAKAFAALIAAACAIWFTIRLVNRRDDPEYARFPTDEPEDEDDCE
jgi:hypothetical protein